MKFIRLPSQKAATILKTKMLTSFFKVKLIYLLYLLALVTEKT